MAPLTDLLGRDVSLRSAHSPAECLDRLGKVTNDALGLGGPHRVSMLKLSGMVRLSVGTLVPGPPLRVRMAGTNTGTLMDCRIGLSRLEIAFIALGPIAIGIFSGFQAGLLIGMGMGAGSAGIFAVSTSVVREQRQFLLRFLADTTEATIVPP